MQFRSGLAAIYGVPYARSGYRVEDTISPQCFLKNYTSLTGPHLDEIHAVEPSHLRAKDVYLLKSTKCGPS